MSSPETYEKEVKVHGNGKQVQKGNTVTVHCTGYGKDRDLNHKFWSTKDPGQEPFTFQVGMGNVIKCWDEGVLTMKVGEKSVLTCKPNNQKLAMCSTESCPCRGNEQCLSSAKMHTI